MTYAQYDKTTGFINGTTNQMVDDDLLPPNIGQVKVQNGLLTQFYMVNLQTLEIEPIP